MTNVEALQQAADRLQTAYDRRRSELADAIAPIGAARGLTAEDMRDGNGRSILLDALTALVNARAALVLAEAAALRCPDHGELAGACTGCAVERQEA